MVKALSLVGVQRRVRLSLVGDDWPTVRGRVKRLASSLRRDIAGEWEWLWVVERNPRGTGHHVHALQRGTFVSQQRLQNLCSREGMGFPWIAAHRSRHQGGWDGAYELKHVLQGDYELKGASDAEHLVLNGKRLAHWSRGWWGKPYRELLRDLSGSGTDPGPWVRERRLYGSESP